MTWVKLSDTLYDDPDMEGISLAAVGAFATILSYCGKHETDGFVTRERALVLARGKRVLLRELIAKNDRGEAPMIQNGVGFHVRNWTKYNPSKVELTERREEWNARQREKREKDRAEKERLKLEQLGIPGEPDPL